MSSSETSLPSSLNNIENDQGRHGDIQIKNSLSNSRCLPSPYSGHLSIPSTSQRGLHRADPEDSVRNGFNERPHGSSGESLASADIGNAYLPCSAKVQEQPLTPHVATDIVSPSLASRNDPRSESPTDRLRRELGDLQGSQEAVPHHDEGPPIFPEKRHFPPSVSMVILDPIIDVPIRHCIIMLHHHGKDERMLKELAKRLQQELKESAFLLLRGLEAAQGGKGGFHWADPDRGSEEAFLDASRMILLDIVKDGLMANCHFQPREIVILGHRQGGMAALAVAASWNRIEFGGVISVGGPIPAYIQLQHEVKAKTSALILGGTLGNITATALQQVIENFTHVDRDLRRGVLDEIPDAAGIRPLLEFLAHRLRREEWAKQAVISFDGGGIRGYGSLLILKDLMNKIGDEEKRQDDEERQGPTESSFAPFAYKPMSDKVTVGDTNNVQSQRPSVSSDDHCTNSDYLPHTLGAESRGLHHSRFFLPCHYFTYAAGTSTGGLISIMLARFRMTVDDCIKEYKTLGEKIFGNPRPLAKGAVLWHKYDRRALRSAVEDVTRRYSERSVFGAHYPLHEDVCKCIVFAIADYGGADFPWLFRTYGTSEPPPHPNGGKRDRTNYGAAANIPIWQVARATSAAPGYFAPIEIEKGNEAKALRFKDGGFGYNNPSHEAYKDVINKHGGMHSDSMGPFISIGTGDSDLAMFHARPGNLNNTLSNWNAVKKLPSRTMKAHDNMEKASFHDNKEFFPYYRFDGGERLGKIAMDEWKGDRFKWPTRKRSDPGYKTLEKMDVATATYLQDRDVDRRLKECAKLLVRRRRLRARYISEWDRYASFSFYECDFKGCQQSHVDKADDFRKHLRDVHHISRLRDEVMDNKLRECRRIYWVYRPDSVVPKPAATGEGKPRA